MAKYLSVLSTKKKNPHIVKAEKEVTREKQTIDLTT